MAVELCYSPDDLQAIDFEMTFRSKHALDTAREIAEVGENGDRQQLFQLSTFLGCDLMVLSAYKAEAIDRGVMDTFRTWMEAAQQLKVQ